MNEPVNPNPQAVPPSAEAKPSEAKIPLETRQERLWGTFCHLSALAGFLGVPAAAIIAPLAIWILKKEDSAYVNEQGKEAINYQLTVALAGVLGIIFLLFNRPLGIVTLLAVVVVDFVFVIIASLRANQGELYQYPFSIRFIS